MLFIEYKWLLLFLLKRAIEDFEETQSVPHLSGHSSLNVPDLILFYIALKWERRNVRMKKEGLLWIIIY